MCSINAVTCHSYVSHARYQALAEERACDITFTHCLNNPPPLIVPSKVQAGSPCLVRLLDSDSCGCSRSTRRLFPGRYHCCSRILVDYCETDRNHRQAKSLQEISAVACRARTRSQINLVFMRHPSPELWRLGPIWQPLSYCKSSPLFSCILELSPQNRGGSFELEEGESRPQIKCMSIIQRRYFARGRERGSVCGDFDIIIDKLSL